MKTKEETHLATSRIRGGVAIFLLFCAFCPSSASAGEIDATNDEALKALRQLAEMKTCANNCVKSSISLLRSQGLECVRNRRETVCRNPAEGWGIAVYNSQFVNPRGERGLLEATLRLSKNEPRMPAEIKDLLFPSWDWEHLLPPEHVFVSKDSIQLQLNGTVRTILFASDTAKPESVMDSAILVIRKE